MKIKVERHVERDVERKVKLSMKDIKVGDAFETENGSIYLIISVSYDWCDYIDISKQNRMYIRKDDVTKVLNKQPYRRIYVDLSMAITKVGEFNV